MASLGLQERIMVCVMQLLNKKLSGGLTSNRKVAPHEVA
jgi:hypothetical protein